MITFFIETLELPNFGHMNTSTKGLEQPILLTSSKLQLRFLKQHLKTQKKFKELEIMYKNVKYIYFLI